MKLDNYFLVKDKKENLLKFSCEENIGIIYESVIKNKTINIIISKSMGKYFYLFEDYKKGLNLIFQNLKGDIILSNINNSGLKDKKIFLINSNFITPINMKVFLLKDKFRLLYSLDSDPTQIYYSNSINSKGEIIYKENNDIYINYKILEEKEYIALLIHSISFNIFKIILKTYNIKSEKWEKERYIFISSKPYIDMSFCTTNNKLHSLIITNEERKKMLIYKYYNLDKDECIKREIMVYEDYDISSCLIIELDNIIWLLWISKKKMYGCYSLDFGERFSSVILCINEIEENIRKVQYIDNGKNKEIYIKEINNKKYLFLEELLNYKYSFYINHKEITHVFKENNILKKQINKNIDDKLVNINAKI